MASKLRTALVTGVLLLAACASPAAPSAAAPSASPPAASTARGPFLRVVAQQGWTLTGLDPATLRDDPAARALSGGGGVSASADGSTLASTEYSAKSTITIIDAATGGAKEHLSLGYRTDWTELAADGSRLAVLEAGGSASSGRWRIYDLPVGRMVGSFALDEPWGRWDPALRHIYTVLTPGAGPTALGRCTRWCAAPMPRAGASPAASPWTACSAASGGRAARRSTASRS